MRLYDKLKLRRQGGLLVTNPFVSRAQQRACYARDDPAWDCDEWQAATGGKKLPKRAAVRNARRASPTKVAALDPTRTGTLRRVQELYIQQCFDKLLADVRVWVLAHDGHGPPTTNGADWDRQNVITDYRLNAAVWGLSSSQEPTVNVAFGADPSKLQAFQAWLKTKVLQYVVGPTQEQLWAEYIRQGFQKGAGASFDAVRQSELRKKHPEYFTPTAQKSVQDFYEGTKSEFLESSFALPASQDKVELLASRTFDELENVTADMSNRLSRVLTDGMVQGASPGDVARDMEAQVGISRERAHVISRTELIRAHAEGQLLALEKMGVTHVGVMVEWTTAGIACSQLPKLSAPRGGGGRGKKGGGKAARITCVCPLCEAMQGVVLTVEEARGLIPRHPGCRCAWIPAQVGEDDEGQTKDKEGIDRALERAGLDDVDVAGVRPESILNLDPRYLYADEVFGWEVTNAFCPTGPGGGVNPTCSPGGGAVHSQSGLSVGHTFSKTYRGHSYSITVQPSGFHVTDAAGNTRQYSSLTAAAQGIKGNHGPVSATNGWAFFSLSRPQPGATTSGPPPTPASAPVPSPTPASTPASPSGAVHAQSKLPVGHTFTKQYRGVTHTLQVTSAGIQVTGAGGATRTYPSLTAAAQGVRGNTTAVNGWAFFGQKPPQSGGTPAAAPVPAPPAQVAAAPIPHLPEIRWETGVAHTAVSGRLGAPVSGTVLNGVPFTPAPPKFWEKVRDVDVREPPPLVPIKRAGVMIQEPDGRVWVVQPTNDFGDRKHTLPGGGVEHGLTTQQNALKEVWEETGLQVEITGHLGDFRDSNNGNIGRLYIGKRVGGAPWDAKIEDGKHGGPTITYKQGPKQGQYAAESASVTLVTKERAAELLHRSDDLAQLATVQPIKVDAKATGEMMQKIVQGVQPKAEAYKKGLGGQAPGDATLHAVQELRGFNGRPQVVARAAMDNLLQQGTHIELMRGISDTGSVKGAKLAEQFRTGTHFPGGGVFGNGTYADATRGTNNVAGRNYGGNGNAGVLRMALPKTAKIIQHSELEKLVGVGKNPANYARADNNGARAQQWLGVQAALAGYDAIHVDGHSKTNSLGYGNPTHSATEGFYVILNRSIVTVQKENAKGHVIQ